MSLSAFKPSAPKHILLFAAGLLWSLVGGMLCFKGYQWLAAGSFERMVLLEFGGGLAAIAAAKLWFSKIAGRNIERLDTLSGKQCFFAFQPWKSYFIIIFMVLLGMTLRQSPVPRSVLAVIYTVVGGALFLSSFLYYRRILLNLTGKKHIS